jgi:ABC-type nickel/cobalt efflux system permease component RcnA
MSDTGLPDIPPPGAPKEPVLTRGAVTAFVTAALVLFVAFGVHISNDRQAAILGIIAPLAVIVTAVWSRLKTFSPRTVRMMVQQARADERGKHAAKDTSEADIRDVQPGWLRPGDTSPR